MLTESMEDYLEMIYRLQETKGYVRVVDLAEALGVQPSSVTRMIRKLSERGLVCYEKYRRIALTRRGTAVGRFLLWRDRTLQEFLTLLRVPVGVQDQVEGIEHYITPPTMCLIRNLVIYFAGDANRLRELEELGREHRYPDGEQLLELRAWLFRHGEGLSPARPAGPPAAKTTAFPAGGAKPPGPANENDLEGSNGAGNAGAVS
ncbi:MAG: transcriptional regulator MntR [Firmicutes bacterium]|nr:transcriptional regulator MntR [Bacillota bacterium]